MHLKFSGILVFNELNEISLGICHEFQSKVIYGLTKSDHVLDM